MKKEELDALCPVDYMDPAALAVTDPRPAILFDRDGTLHVDKVKTHRLEDLEYFEDSFSALRELAALGYRLVIVTNQNGIAEGLFTAEDMRRFNARIQEDMAANGVHFDAIYYAPHLPEEDHISYKPNEGMLLRAAQELHLDLARSFMIGDKVSDVEAARRAGVTGIMVTTGIYRSGSYRTPAYEALQPVTVSSLTEAVAYIRAHQK